MGERRAEREKREDGTSTILSEVSSGHGGIEEGGGGEGSANVSRTSFLLKASITGYRSFVCCPAFIFIRRETKVRARRADSEPTRRQGELEIFFRAS